MQRLLSDFSSWYWWVSVVVVGLLVNLASAYIKPVIDNRLATRSQALQERKSRRVAAFKEDVNLLASDSTLLVIAGQRFLGTQIAVMVLILTVALLISFVFVFAGNSSQVSPWRAIAQWIDIIGLFVLLVLLLALMRKAEEMGARVGAARRLFRTRLLAARNDR